MDTDRLLLEIYSLFLPKIVITEKMAFKVLSFFFMIVTSAGSIPDSYDIYGYLNLVRYSILSS